MEENLLGSEISLELWFLFSSIFDSLFILFLELIFGYSSILDPLAVSILELEFLFDK